MSVTSVSKKNIRRIVGGVLIAVTIGAGTYWVVVDDHAAPIRTAQVLEQQGRASSLVIPVTVSLDELQKRLNAELPDVLASIDENRDGCVPAQWVKAKWFFGLKTKVTPAIDCHLKGEARRGTIQVGGRDGQLTFSVPVQASLTATGRGEIGRHIRSTATGSIEVNAGLQADIDEGWRPSAAVNVDYSWTNRIGVDVLGFRITFADKVDPQLRKLVDKLKERLPEMLAKLAVKDRAAEAWNKGFATLRIGQGPDVWMRFRPEAIGYNGYRVVGRELRFSVMAAGRTETFVGAAPAALVPTPLPPLRRDLPNKGLDVSVPVSVDYATLAGAARSALKVGETQSFALPGRGTVKATFSDVAVYQTEGRRLAVGLTLDTDASAGFMNLVKARGTVWFVADVRIDNASKRVKVENLSVLGRTDSSVVNLLAAIATLPSVNRALVGALEYDFSKKYDDALRQANDALNRPLSPDFALAGKVDDGRVDYVAAAPEGLVAGLSIRGQAEIRPAKLVN